MRYTILNRSTRRLLALLAILLLSLTIACEVNFNLYSPDTQATISALSTEKALLSSEVARQGTLMAYLATRVGAGVPSQVTVMPSQPSSRSYVITGSVLIEGGACCVGGIAGQEIQVNVSFVAQSNAGAVTEMRVLVGSLPMSEAQFANLPWEPYTEQQAYSIVLATNWVGYYVSVQYRDDQGNISQVYFDDISVEGMPAPPTSAP